MLFAYRIINAGLEEIEEIEDITGEPFSESFDKWLINDQDGNVRLLKIEKYTDKTIIYLYDKGNYIETKDVHITEIMQKIDYTFFINSREKLTKEEYVERYYLEIEDINTDYVYSYLGGLYIEINGGGTFTLIMGRSEYIFDNIQDAEKKFWDDFVKNETGHLSRSDFE